MYQMYIIYTMCGLNVYNTMGMIDYYGSMWIYTVILIKLCLKNNKFDIIFSIIKYRNGTLQVYFKRCTYIGILYIILIKNLNVLSRLYLY